MYSFPLEVFFWAKVDVNGQKTLQRQPITIPSCHRSTTVCEVRAQVASAVGVPVNLILQQRTPGADSTKGTILKEDDRTLSELGIDNAETCSKLYAVGVPKSQPSREWQVAADALESQGLQYYRSGGDGNCLFRSVSKLVYGTEQHHELVRNFCMDYMVEQRHAFEPIAVSRLHRDGFESYIAAKRKSDGSYASYGDEPELLAMSELYRRPIQVWIPDDSEAQWRVERTYSHSLQSAPIRVCFLGKGHYDAIVPTGGAAGEDTQVDHSHPGKYEDEVIKQVKTRTPKELAAIDRERTAYQQLVTGGNLEQAISEQARHESLIQFRQEALRELDQTVDESLRLEFQRETDEALGASQRDAEELLQATIQKSINDEEQRRMDAAANASVAEQQKRNEEAMEKARKDSIKETVKKELISMGYEAYRADYGAEYVAEHKEDLSMATASAIAFLQQEQGDVTPTNGNQSQEQIISQMVSMGYPKWVAEYAANNANDIDSAISMATQMM